MIPMATGPVHNVITSFRLSREERVWLQRMADADGKPMATLIREAIAVYVGDFQEQVDAPWLQRGVGLCNSPKGN